MPNLVAIVNCVDIYHGQTNTVISKNSKLRPILVRPYSVLYCIVFKWAQRSLNESYINKKLTRSQAVAIG